MKRFICLLLLSLLVILAITACTVPGDDENTSGFTDRETVEKTEESSDTQQITEQDSETATEEANGSSEETTVNSTETDETSETGDAEENTTEEKENTTTEAPLPSIDELNNNAYGEAYYIAEIFGLYSRPNGWNVDDRFDIYNTTGQHTLSISDSSDSEFKSFFRDFDEESEGILRLGTIVSASSSNGGLYIAFEDSDENKIVKLVEKNSYWALIGKTEIISDISIPDHSTSTLTYAISLEIDLDRNIASVIINNKYVGQVEISSDAALTRLIYGCERKGCGSITMEHTELNKNYPLSDNFLYTSTSVNEIPVLWDVEGNFRIQTIASEQNRDVYSVKAENVKGTASTAARNFDKIYGKISFETFILLPEKVNGASVALTSSGHEVLKFETVDGKLVMGNVVLHDYVANVWQCLHIDADTDTGIAKIYVNGKERATVEFSADSFDGVKVEFAPDRDAVMWFDDVVLYNLYDYADYPSYPQVAESADYNVGVNVCWLWRDQNSAEGWEATSAFSELDTYLGFYDEGLRETADWELKYMAEHGIDFIHACWYCPNGNQTAPIKKMRVSYSALHEGYMHAKYSDLVDFCIMWENSMQDVTSFEQFKEYLWKYWKEYYLSDPRYARLDNKAVITVWSFDKMASAFGGAQNVNAVIEFMDQELKDMGYDGLILLFATQGSQTQDVYKHFDSFGFDGSYAYHYGTQGYSAEHQINCNRTNYENSLGISHHIPTISIGFNDVARNDSRDPVISAEDHLKVCEDAKEILSLYNTGTWRDNTVMISTWNEFSEGTYIFPCEQNGFSYLENIRKAFTNDTSDHSKIDVKPTQSQVDRVSHMYPDNHSPIRWLQFEESDEQKRLNDVDGYISIQKHDLTTERDAKRWSISHGISSLTYSSGALVGVSSHNDYGIQTKLSPRINASDAPVLHIRMQSSTKEMMEIFFATVTEPNFDGSRRVQVSIKETDKMVDYYILLSSNRGWKGQISRIRIDPGTTVNSTFIIEVFELMNFPAADTDSLEIKINHNDYDAIFAPVPTSDGDWEVVGETRKGFFSMMMLYHEWDRFSGKLTVMTKDEKIIEFTVGSDKITVNGKEQALGYTFALRDGLPVFRINSLCELLGYKYTLDGNKIMIQSCTDYEYEMLGSRIEGSWDFNYKGFTDGWSSQGGTIEIDGGGTLILTPINNDSAIVRSVILDSTNYDLLVVGVKYFVGLEEFTSAFYFLTSSDNVWNEAKSVKAAYDIPSNVVEGDTVYAIFDLTSCENWNETITAIRIDAIWSSQIHEFDSVQFTNK